MDIGVSLHSLFEVMAAMKGKPVTTVEKSEHIIIRKVEYINTGGVVAEW